MSTRFGKSNSKSSNSGGNSEGGNPNRVKVGVAFLNGENKEATENQADLISDILGAIRENGLRLVVRPPFEKGKPQPFPSLDNVNGSVFLFPTDPSKSKKGTPPDFDVIGFKQ